MVSMLRLAVGVPVLAAVATCASSPSVRVTHVATEEVEGEKMTVDMGPSSPLSASASSPSTASLSLLSTSADAAAGSAGKGHWEARSAPVSLGSIGVGYESQVFGVGLKDQTAYQFDTRSGKWGEFDGGAGKIKVTQLELSCGSTLHAIDAKGMLWRKAKGSSEGNWEALTQSTAEQIAVGKDDDIWILDGASNAYYYVAGERKFEKAGVRLKSVAVACDGAVWAVTMDNDLVERVDGEFRKRGSGVAKVRAASAVYVLDASDGELMRYRTAPSDSSDPPRKYWYSLQRKLKDFSVGPDETLWGLDASGVAVMHTGADMEAELNEEERAELQLKQGGSWKVLPLSAGSTEVASGQKGELYAINSDGDVVKFDRLLEEKWEVIPAPKLVRLAVGCDGVSLWGVTADGMTHRYRGGGHWIRYSEKLEDINLGADETHVYGLKLGNHELVRFDPKTKRWLIEKNGDGNPVQLLSLSAGCDQSVWGIDTEGRLMASSALDSPGAWLTLGEEVRQVAVGRHVYVLDRKNYLYRYRKPAPGQKEGKQNWKFLHKQLRVVDTNPAGELVGIDLSGNVVRFRPQRYPSGSSWKPIQDLAPVASVSVGAADNVYAVDPYGVALRLGTTRQWNVDYPGVPVESISAGCDGEVWVIRKDGTVARRQRGEGAGAPYTEQLGAGKVAGSKVTQISVGSSKYIAAVTEDGNVHIWREASGTWKTLPIPDNYQDRVDYVSVSCRGSLWVVGRSGVAYRRVGRDPSRWMRFGLNAATICAGYRVLMMDRSRVLWKYESEVSASNPWKKWVRLGAGMASVSCAADGTAWGVDRTGKSWLLRAGTGPQKQLPVLGLATPTPTPELFLPDQPDGQSVSPFVAGSNKERAFGPGKVTDLDDVTTMIKHHEENLKFEKLAAAKSPYSPFEFEEDTFGSSPFKTIDEEVTIKRNKVPEKF